MLTHAKILGYYTVRKLFRQTLGFNPEFLSELGMTKLTNTKLKWIVRKSKIGISNKCIAEAINVSKRRIQQIIKKYKLTKIIPALIKSRRPKTEITEDKKEAINLAFEETKLSPTLLPLNYFSLYDLFPYAAI